MDKDNPSQNAVDFCVSFHNNCTLKVMFKSKHNAIATTSVAKPINFEVCVIAVSYIPLVSECILFKSLIVFIDECFVRVLT